MVVVDTCGWIEWLTDGQLADVYAPFLADSGNLIVPTLVQFELYRWCLREKNEAIALDVIGLTEACRVRPLDTRIALSAADLCAQHKLAIADAVVYASALAVGAELLTSDAHFTALPGVRYWQKAA
ncbi:type II toxin-antitoxin system VapC family toxin [Sulfuriferula sp.]|uniref:type II toxin-antitoxin system VapC family toxin n=1 Tax=Sulfuriferula sp. TaxID=2025307 RepID=UPI002730B773|nr:type II toxin-antitoxin system VapC family toxin [Sulfuriferula sp.]MDP2024995.1 type II toxin-antitoxin system VapC family toxin [Sulfuriferula sp.]